ncbi:hypothetical protein AAJ76_680001595 [Vairimorpha ceranae]|uniref:Uncharacterized protein n=1 Tax=Vairimorpha ceranae TaxID=40302 RepID=A0A0F9Z9G1_9MICR|nr:hypothetical protein AAJ76_680001595 [Vairimorpha ceranae]KKO74464.1 hypothetical protein AAJ76_680001595 [Vairimorpha ceranae]
MFYTNNYIYKCNDYKCRKRSFACKLSAKNARVAINKKFLAIYEFLACDYVKRVMNDCDISKLTFQKLKINVFKYISSCVEKYENIILRE